MQDSPISVRGLALAAFFSILFISFIYLTQQFNSETRIVLCHMEKGDATYIRVKNKIDILINAGGNNDILTCLGRNMPFYDKTIEYAFLTNTKKESYTGYVALLDKYIIKNIYIPPKESISKTYETLMETLADHKVNVYQAVASNDVNVLNANLSFVSAREENTWYAVMFKENRFNPIFSGAERYLEEQSDNTNISERPFFTQIYGKGLFVNPHSFIFSLAENNHSLLRINSTTLDYEYSNNKGLLNENDDSIFLRPNNKEDFTILLTN